MASPSCAVPHTDRDQLDHNGLSCLSVFWNLCFLRCFTCYLTMAVWRGTQEQHQPLCPILTVTPSLIQLFQRLWTTQARFTLSAAPHRNLLLPVKARILSDAIYFHRAICPYFSQNTEVSFKLREIWDAFLRLVTCS